MSYYRSCYGDALFLTAGKAYAAFSDLCKVSVRHGDDIVMSERIKTDTEKTETEYAVLLHPIFEITKINGVNFTNNTYTDRTGRNITKRVCNILCDVQVNGSQPIQQEQPQFQDSSADTPFATDDNGASGKPDTQLYFDDIDDINLPF